MGLGPISADLPGALHALPRSTAASPTPRDRHVWGVFGDGEMDEPESIGALSLAARERLDNLTFIINCNLQRLDGPVRGNGQIIQELEALFTGAGWNVDQGAVGLGLGPAVRARHPARAAAPLRRHRRRQVPDARRQGRRLQPRPLLRARTRRSQTLVAHMIGRRDRRAQARRPRLPQALRRLRRRRSAQGPADRDPRQDQEGLRHGRRRREPHDRAPGEEARHRRAAGLPRPLRAAAVRRRRRAASLLSPGRRQPRDALPARAPRRARRPAAARRSARAPAVSPCRRSTPTPTSRSTPTARKCRRPWPPCACSATCSRTRRSGRASCPSSPTRRAPSAWPTCSARSASTRRWASSTNPRTPARCCPTTKRATASCSRKASPRPARSPRGPPAATTYSVHGLAMLPIYIYYSMFGFQRVGDLIWAAADQRARGFLVGATAGRTTLGGEGLQHQDGTSHVVAATDPELPRLRSGLRLRTRGDRRSRHAPHDGASSATSSTTSPS